MTDEDKDAEDYQIEIQKYLGQERYKILMNRVVKEALNSLISNPKAIEAMHNTWHEWLESKHTDQELLYNKQLAAAVSAYLEEKKKQEGMK